MNQQENSPNIVSCGEQTLDCISKMLKEESFPLSETIVKGIMNIVNLVSDYHEEGVRLFPEVIILKNETSLTFISARKEQIFDDKIDEDSFSRVMKLCAPLANNNWSIYIIIPDADRMIYGVVSSELKETSLSLKEQVISTKTPEDHFLYIRNIGSKNVELINSFHTSIVSLTLDDNFSNQDEDITNLINAILSDIDKDDDYSNIFSFVFKTITDALNAGHGNLIAVCKDDDINNCIKDMSGGAKITEPIDIPLLLKNDVTDKSNITSVAIKSNIALIKSMINHDGITFISTKGRVLAYHYIVKNDKVANVKTVGGSRTKAFEALKTIPGIYACFFKSQDGLTKFHCND